MASRDWLKHSAGSSAPSDSTLGDEWFNTSTNRLSKRVATNGTTVEWREVAGGIGVQQNGTTFASSATILNFANATLQLDGVTGAVRITSTSAPGGSDTQVQLNSLGNLIGSSAFTFNPSTNLLTATGNVNFIGTAGTTKTMILSPNTGAGDFTTSSVLLSLGNPSGGNPPTLSQIQFNNWSGGAGADIQYSNTSSEFLIRTNSTVAPVILATTGGNAIRVMPNANTVQFPSLTSGRVTFATTSGQLTDSANLTWNGSTFGVTGFVTTNRANLTGGINSTSWSGATGAGFNTAGTITDTSGAGGTVASRVNYSFNAATMAANVATTVTLGINLFVVAPVAGTNTTFSDNYALYSQGRTRSVGALIADTTFQQIDGLMYRSANTAVATAGSVQGDATAITRNINNVSSVGATTQGVRLPVPAVAGVRIVVRNATGTSFRIYPHSGGQINTLGTNVSLDLLAAQAVEFVAVTTAQWVTLNATYGA